MIRNFSARMENSITYRDFKRLFTFKRNIDEFEHPGGLTFSDNSFLRYLSFAALYFAQGIPGGLLHYAIPAWMATVGYSAMDVGTYLAVVTLPWSFKLIAAPMMDRFTFLPMGRRRPWLIGGQLGIVLGLIALSTVRDPGNELSILMFIGFGINLFTIFQDIATDGLAIDVLPEHQQARANGLMWGSKTIGISVIVAITILLIKSIGFGATMLVFAVMVSVIMIFPLIIKERPEEKRLPWTRGKISGEVLKLQLPSWKLILNRLIKVFFLPVSLMMGFAAFSLSVSVGFMAAALPVFTVQELGWADNQYPEILSTSKLIGGILGMFIGGALIDIIGKIRMVSWLIGLMVLLIGLFAIMNNYWQDTMAVNAFILVYHILDVFITIVIFAMAMVLCWKQVAATQFTLYMTIANLGQSFGSYVFGHMEQWVNWQFLFLFNVLCFVIMFAFIRFVNVDRHQGMMLQKMGMEKI